MFGLGAGGFPHVKPELEPETCDNLRGHMHTVIRKERPDPPPPPPSHHPVRPHLSGGVADAVQGEQVSGVGHGVELGDGGRDGGFDVL